MTLSSDSLATAMRQACHAARVWVGATSPNPPVGAAALDAQGRVLAVAAHQRAGMAHAEAALLAQLRGQGLLAQAHTLCVTLEPCNHHGRTPPCSEAIIAAGIRHVAVGIADPNPLVAGGGMARLRASGIEVVSGIEENLCRQLLAAFAYSVTQNRPWLTVKQARNHQGGMIPPAGQKTFTSPESLRLAHRLRKRADAILTGSGTILADDPHFTVRHVPDHADKQRVLAILDRRRRVPEAYLAAARGRGFIPVVYDNLATALDDLTQRGVREVLVEAGAAVTQTVLDSQLWSLQVVIEQGEPDQVTTLFHPSLGDTADWSLAMMLPEEI